ncbi:AraC family transcriptional regulator [Actinoplanes sp. NPDC051851]|uniref:AraC family transcriptional regulator n=1 Tax=Actinoplanes sp. NPDC051851 TaxID=3154753 RepID=UPI003433EE61
MDPLSEVLSLLKPRSYITAGFDAGRPWALELDDLAGRIKCYAVVRGSCRLTLEGDATPVVVPEGACFVLPTGRTAVIGSDPGVPAVRASEVLDPNRSGEAVTYRGGGDVYLVGSRFEMGSPHAAALLRTLPPLILVETDDDRDRLRRSIEMMMAELRDGRPGADLMAQHLAHMMLVQALRLYLAARSPRETGDTGWFAALADPELSGAIGAMHADPGHAWTLRELAARSGMSRTVFAERFRERSGETPIAYLTRWRMTLAAERLREGTETLARIAHSLGYASEPAFTTAFRRVMGAPPGRYARSLAPPGSRSRRRPAG